MRSIAEIRKDIATRKYQVYSLEKELQSVKDNVEYSARLAKFERSYSGCALLTTYSRDTYGIWEIRGEDPNCDLGGSHHEPYLGTFEGKLGDIIKKAVTMKRFYTWGGGGNIKKVDITKV